jgi:hypothetical protein
MESRVEQVSPEPGLASLPARKTRSGARRGLTDSFAVIGPVFQQPKQFFREIREGIRLSEKIGSLLISSAVFLTVYGAILGSGHPLLSLNAALTVPFLFLSSLIICIPVMYLFDVLTGSQRSLAQVVAVLLTSLCAASTVFSSFSLIIMVYSLTGDLVNFFGLNLAILAMAALVGLIYVTQGIIQTALVDTNHSLSRVNQWLHFLWILLYLAVISQMAWGALLFFQKTGGFPSVLILQLMR